MSKVVVEQDGNVVTCRLNRPEALNAIDEEMHEALEKFFSDLTYRDDVDVVILLGEGRAFCAGGDVKGMEEGLTSQEMPGGMFTRGALRIIRNLVEVPQITISFVNGPAIGLGATLALFCDIVIASERAVFSDPHVSVGLVAGDGGAVIWPLLIGMNRAKEFLLTGDRVMAAEAERLGLVNHVYPESEAQDEMSKLAQRLSNGAPAALRWTKASVNKVLRERVNLILDSSLALEGLSAETKDHREGVRAFLEKRSPHFRHE